MNISPILLLSIGASFGFLYGMIITIGWAITRKNRRKYHNERGLESVTTFSLLSWKALDKKVETFSLTANHFTDADGGKIITSQYDYYIVADESPVYPKISKGNLILIDPEQQKIVYAFDIPDLKNYR